MAYKFPDSVQIPMAQTLHIMQALITIAFENAAPRLHNFIGHSPPDVVFLLRLPEMIAILFYRFCPCLGLSGACGIVSKQMHISSNFFDPLVGAILSFSEPHSCYKIPREAP